MSAMLPDGMLTNTLSVWRYLGRQMSGSTARRYSTTAETAKCRVTRKTRTVKGTDETEGVSTHTISTNLDVGPLDMVSTDVDAERRIPLDVMRTQTPDGRTYTRIMI